LLRPIEAVFSVEAHRQILSRSGTRSRSQPTDHMTRPPSLRWSAV
jgi:hypothetical protein